MTGRADGKSDLELEAEAKKKAYDEEERIIEENRQKKPEPPSQQIRWAYRSKINESVYCMNDEGAVIPQYNGKFTTEDNEGVRKVTGIAARILEDAPPEAEFYTSYSGELSFVPQTREQWVK